MKNYFYHQLKKNGLIDLIRQFQTKTKRDIIIENKLTLICFLLKKISNFYFIKIRSIEINFR
jgi:hypothetical protein